MGGCMCGAQRVVWRSLCWMGNTLAPSTLCSLTHVTWHLPVPALTWWDPVVCKRYTLVCYTLRTPVEKSIISFFVVLWLSFRRFGCRALKTHRPAAPGCCPVILHLECKQHIRLCCWLTVKNFVCTIDLQLCQYAFKPLLFYIMFIMFSCTEKENIFCQVFIVCIQLCFYMRLKLVFFYFVKFVFLDL